MNNESVSPPITVILQSKLFSILGIFLYTSSYINNLLRSRTVAPIAMGLFKTVRIRILHDRQFLAQKNTFYKRGSTCTIHIVLSFGYNTNLQAIPHILHALPE